jgi:hypothetical protein
MLAFEALLVRPAKAAGMKVPADPEKFDEDAYPHFAVFLNVQLGAPMPSPTAPEANARLIAELPEKVVRKITHRQLLDRGLVV